MDTYHRLMLTATRPSTRLQFQTHVLSLPPELILHVFSFLSLKELQNTVSHVCQKWRILQNDPHLYREINFREQEVDFVVDIVKKATLLESLTVTGCGLRPILGEVCNNNPPLKKLSLTNGRVCECTHTGNFEYNLLQVIRSSPKLVVLRMLGFSRIPAYFYNSLSRMVPNLVVIHFQKLGLVSNAALLSVVVNCHNLEELKVSNNLGADGLLTTLTDTELITLSEKMCSTLRVLHLDYGQWSPNALNSLRRCQCLEDLGFLHGKDLSTKALSVITSLPLKKLKLSHCKNLSVQDWKCLVTNTAMACLQALILDNCSTTNEVAVAIGMHLHNLESLCIVQDWNPFSASYFCNAHITHITRTGFEKILTGCSRLEIFFVSCLVDLDTIMLIPTKAPAIRKLLIQPVRRCINGWNTLLKDQMPNLTILRTIIDF